MRLKVQDLLANKTYDEMKAELDLLNIEHHIEESGGVKYLHLDYSIFSPKDNEIVKECRGLVLYFNSLEIFRYGFYRFLNYGEMGCDTFEAGTPLIYDEKVDGSLVILTFDSREKWVVGTRGQVFARTNISGTDITFEEMFWYIFDRGADRESLDSRYCYIFEICGPENRIVIPYSRELVLTGARLKETWEELKDEELDKLSKKLNIRRPKKMQFGTLEECLKTVGSLPANEEGYVVKQWSDAEKQYHRAKVKGDSYCYLHNLVSTRNNMNLMRLVIKGQREIFKSMGNFLIAYDKIFMELMKFCLKADGMFDKAYAEIFNNPAIELKDQRKQFALFVKDSPMQSYFFTRLDRKSNNMLDYLNHNVDRDGLIKQIIEAIKVDEIVDISWNLRDEKTSIEQPLTKEILREKSTILAMVNEVSGVMANAPHGFTTPLTSTEQELAEIDGAFEVNVYDSEEARDLINESRIGSIKNRSIEIDDVLNDVIRERIGERTRSGIILP